MVVRLVSASLVLDQPRLLGTFQFHDDRTGEPVLRQVNVVQTDAPPGYVLTDTSGAELRTVEDPVRWEADRLVRVLTLPADEVTRRAATARAAKQGGLIFHADPEDDDWWMQRQFFRYVRGELTRDELDTVARIVTRRAPEAEAVWEPDAVDTFPEQWWQAAEDRYRQRIIDSTVSMAEAAALLDCTIPDLDEMLGRDQLIDILFDPNAEESELRIPRWQLRPSAKSDGRMELLPGLSVVLVAAPRLLNEGGALTRFMTTPNDGLEEDGEPMTPAAWLAADRPLADVMRVLTWRAG